VGLVRQRGDRFGERPGRELARLRHDDVHVGASQRPQPRSFVHERSELRVRSASVPDDDDGPVRERPHAVVDAESPGSRDEQSPTQVVLCAAHSFREPGENLGVVSGAQLNRQLGTVDERNHGELVPGLADGNATDRRAHEWLDERPVEVTVRDANHEDEIDSIARST